MGAVKRKCDDISRGNHEQVLPGVAHDNDVQADGLHRGHVQADARDDPTRLHDHRGAQRPDNQEEDAQRNQAEDARRPQRLYATVEEIEAGIARLLQECARLRQEEYEFNLNLEETIEHARQVYNNYTRAIWRVDVLRCGGCKRCAMCVDQPAVTLSGSPE